MGHDDGSVDPTVGDDRAMDPTIHSRFAHLPSFMNLCEPCSMLFAPERFERLRADPKNPPTGETIIDPSSGCYVCLTVYDREKREGSWKYRLSNRYAHDGVDFQLSESDPGLYPANVHLTLHPVDDLASLQAHFLGHTAHRQSYTGDPAVLSLANHWLRDCVKNHKSCRWNVEPPRYPTRLLRIDDQCVRLVDSAEETELGSYATVSHVWGVDKFERLTPDSMGAWRSGFTWRTLPQSFADCIQTVQSLGIRYIWIDCYCILQGQSKESGLDWDRESGLMCSVYSNAQINIGSSHASNPYQGAFVKRQPADRPLNSIIEWRSNATGGKRSLYVILEILKAWRMTDGLFKSTIFQRGWCVQERCLATRMLHFGAHQVWWECEENVIKCEAVPNGIIEPYMSNPFSVTQYVRPAGPYAYKQPPRTAVVHWQDMVEMYSRTRLTYPDQDKLKAVQGITDHMEEILSVRYIWGLQDDKFNRNLQWNCKDEAQQSRSGRAPTWSWASVDGPVEFESWYSPYRDMLCCCHSISGVLSAQLGLGKDRALPCIGRLLDMADVPFYSIDRRTRFDRVDDQTEDMDPDVFRRKFKLLALGANPRRREFPEEYCFLVVERLASGVYQRVGYASNIKREIASGFALPALAPAQALVLV